MKSSVLFQNQPAIEIRRGSSRVLVSPEHGARILRWERNSRELIHWPDDADWARILKVRGGNPVLFPFLARHFVDGKQNFWRDTDGTVREMPQHGFARDATFTVVEEEDDESTLRLRLTDTEATRTIYPFSFQFDVGVRLTEEDSLEIRLQTHNLGARALPYYAGHHFYLAIPHQERLEWSLDLPCRTWGRQAADGSILHETPTAALLSLGDPSLIDRFQIEPSRANVTLRHLSSGRSFVFELHHAGNAPWYAVTTWTEKPDSDFYCVEPWLGLPNAISHGEGLRHVAPGASETATCIIKTE